MLDHYSEIKKELEDKGIGEEAEAKKKPEVKASDYVVIPSNVWTAIAEYVTNQPWKEVDQLISPVKSVPTLAKFMESVEIK